MVRLPAVVRNAPKLAVVTGRRDGAETWSEAVADLRTLERSLETQGARFVLFAVALVTPVEEGAIVLHPVDDASATSSVRRAAEQVAEVEESASDLVSRIVSRARETVGP